MDLFYLAVTGVFTLATVVLLWVCVPPATGDRSAT